MKHKLKQVGGPVAIRPNLAELAEHKAMKHKLKQLFYDNGVLMLSNDLQSIRR